MNDMMRFMESYFEMSVEERRRLLDLVRAMLDSTPEGVARTILQSAETSLEMGDIRRGREFLDRLFPPAPARAVRSTPNYFGHSAGKTAAG